MKTMEEKDIHRAMLIPAGNYRVSIGTYDKTNVAIISNHTGTFCKIANAGRQLKRVKKYFKTYLNSEETFTFSFMQPETTLSLINLLKNK